MKEDPLSPAASEELEHPSQYCPVCSQRLSHRSCKMICDTCGFFLSCSDFY